MNKYQEESFRDHISTTNEEGFRSWVYAFRPSGRLHNYRVLVAVFLLTVFFTLPFIRIHNEPFLMMNFFERKFVIFGNVFWPQDFHIFVIATITLIVTIVLFTVIYGRVWCGWACPQTIFLEMVYRKIEFWIEGNAPKQKKLDSGPLTFGKFWRKSLKHLIFIAIAIIVIHTLVSYIIGKDRVFDLIRQGPSQNFAAFSAISFFVFAYYFVFARFREQVCTLVCPYGRLQGVMLDSNSLVVAYDYRRGEKRGFFKRNEDRQASGKGDCIDCKSCVNVCPTGIDIRNGTQLECINCTACIDACNHVMNRFGFRPGLIRIASANEIAEGRKFRFTGRIAAYTVLLAGLITTLTLLFVLRNDTETTILRVPGSLYQDMGTEITNLYNFKIINKTSQALEIEIRPIELEGRIQSIGGPLIVEPNATGEGVFLLYLAKEHISGESIPVTFGVYSDDTLLEKEKATFIGPAGLERNK